MQPEDAEGKNAIDGGGGLFFVDPNDGPGFLSAHEQAAGVGRAEAAFEVHRGAEPVGRPVGKLAGKRAFEDLEVADAGLLAGRGCAAVAVAGDFEQGGPGLTELKDTEPEGFAAELAGDNAADEIALLAPEVDGAARVLGGERVSGLAHVEEGFAVFIDDGRGKLGEEGVEGGGDGFRLLRRNVSGGRHGDNCTAKDVLAGRARSSRGATTSWGVGLRVALPLVAKMSLVPTTSWGVGLRVALLLVAEMNAVPINGRSNTTSETARSATSLFQRGDA